MCAGDEATEVEQLIGRFAADGGAETREVDGERAVLRDEVANTGLSECTQSAPLRFGELRRERDPTGRARGDDRVALATCAGRAARGGALARARDALRRAVGARARFRSSFRRWEGRAEHDSRLARRVGGGALARGYSVARPIVREVETRRR